MLLEKTDWVHSFQHDQGAYDETVLEMLGMEHSARQGNEVSDFIARACSYYSS